MIDDPGGRRGWPAIVRRTLGLAGGVFVYAGGLKLLDPPRFASDIGNYQILPWPVAVRLAFYLPWLEVLCGLALIFHRLFARGLGSDRWPATDLYRRDVQRESTRN